MSHPCRDCIVISSCKQKIWLKLIKDCDLVKRYVFDNYNPGSENHLDQVIIVKERIKTTFIELYPNCWKPADEGPNWTWVCKVVKR